MSRLDEIAEYAENSDFSAEMEQGMWETDTEEDPMVSTSLRLPKSLLDWVRSQADAKRTKPTTYIRQLIEHARDEHEGRDDIAARVRRLEMAVFPEPSNTEYVDR